MQSLRIHLSRHHGSLTPPDAPLADPAPGALHLTAHHLVFTRDAPEADAQEEKKGAEKGEDEVWVSADLRTIPLTLLHSVTRTPPSLTGEPTPLVLRTRDYLTYTLTFASVLDADAAWDSLKAACGALSTGGLEGRYAFASAKGKERATGWEIYDVEKEFERMGMGTRSKAWRFTGINADFQFCPSYPAKIVVPAKISDTTLNYAVKYRSKSRIPGLVYLHWANLGSITRSSQPMVGITQNARSIQDEKLIEAIFTSHSQHSHALSPMSISDRPSSPASSLSAAAESQIVYGATPSNIIIDARPTKNAYANSVKGAGTENMLYYKNCKKEYLGIDNIHVMRASLNGVFDALADAETTGQLDRAALRRTNWLSHLTNILDGVLIVVRTVHLYNSHVLVHCSDGWDRTSQLSALPQLCLDPFFRTARGFAVLIEKDWVSYGHRFADRSGHQCNDRVDFVHKLGTDASTQQAFLASVTRQFAGSSHAFKETCPVFQQFLDCVYQIQRQFPTRFEWNERLLSHLVRETYADAHGSFLFNSERERSNLHARERTPSVWSTVFEPETGALRPEFRNDAYDPALDDAGRKAPDADQGVLLPDAQDVRWWHELFGRDDDEMNGRPFAADPGASALPTEPTHTEVKVVEGAEDDPILNGVAARTAGLALGGPGVGNGDEPASPRALGALPPLAPSSSAGAEASPRSSSPAQPRGGSAELLSQQQLTETVASVQKLGWSAWKSVRKFGEDAARQLKEQQAARAAEAERERAALGMGGHAEREGSSGSWRALGRSEDGASELSEGVAAGGAGAGGSWGSRAGGMWSKLSATNPWAAGGEGDPSLGGASGVSSRPAATYDAPAYRPYQPRQPSLSSLKGPAAPSARPPPPTSTRQPSSTLSINPWETISREEAVPSSAVSSSAPSPRAPVGPLPPLQQEREEPPRSAGVATDPLGVGLA
ncbi:phosphatidylinositol-3-phosphatase ymr1 [Rhodotorula kratochvilovae]